MTECTDVIAADTMKYLHNDELRIIPCTMSSPEEVWGDVLAKDRDDFLALCQAFETIVFPKKNEGVLARRLAWYLHRFHYRKKGHFIRESDWLAGQSNKILSRSQMAFIQRSYIWAHLACSTVCKWDDKAGENVCMRSLDWAGAEAIGMATRIFDFQDQDQQTIFRAAGIVGMVGVLTGVKKGFSVTINYAPWKNFAADAHADPTLKLRLLLENRQINTYAEAKGAITNWEVGAPVFITLCGIEKDQACVIEIGHHDDKHIRESSNGLLVQTNHFDANSPFKKKNKEKRDWPVDGDDNRIESWYCGRLLPSSWKRQERLTNALLPEFTDSDELNRVLEEEYKRPPVWNFETAHWVRMRPATGDITIWARRKNEE